jgi:hypothetical protein
VSIVFPDLAGEDTVREHRASQHHILHNSKATILIVDPLRGPTYRQATGNRAGKTSPTAGPDYTYDQALQRLIDIKGSTKDEPLAVVLAKCDLLRWTGRCFPRQGDNRFDPDLAASISEEVKWFLSNNLKPSTGQGVSKLQGLGMGNLVQLADQYFQKVCYFAASALGEKHIFREEDDGHGDTIPRVYNVRPECVEEPLLWILHRWGML